MELYYDLNGNPVPQHEWARIVEARSKARKGGGDSTPESDAARIGSDYVGGLWISTTWLGLDHQFGNGPPLIFETMVFPAENGKVTDWGEVFCDRYSTREQALAGHQRVVEALRRGEKL